MSDYAIILAAVREYASGKEEQFDIWQLRWVLSQEIPDSTDPYGSLVRSYGAQVLRAVNVLVSEGALVKTGSGQNARYCTPEVYQRNLGKAAKAHAEWEAEKEAWRQVKMSLADHQLSDLSNSELNIRLSLEDWQTVLTLIEKCEHEGEE